MMMWPKARRVDFLLRVFFGLGAAVIITGVLAMGSEDPWAGTTLVPIYPAILCMRRAVLGRW